MPRSVNRRNFLGASLAGAIALQAGAASLAVAGEKTKKAKCKIGMNLYTIRDFLSTPEDIARSFEKVRKIGYECLEIGNSEAVTPEQMAQLLKDNGLKAVSAHTSWEAVEKDPQKVLDFNRTIGNSHVVVSYMPDPFHNEDGFKKFATMLDGMGARFAEEGMTFGYHHHSFELAKYSGITGQEILMNGSVPHHLSFEIDTYWIQYGGGDPADWIAKTAGRVPIVHMKDMVSLGKEPVFAEVGEGNLNWPAILKACKKAGVQYCVVEQDRCQRDPFESLALSIQNMKSWGLS